jgi:hypothetical protein
MRLPTQWTPNGLTNTMAYKSLVTYSLGCTNTSVRYVFQNQAIRVAKNPTSSCFHTILPIPIPLQNSCETIRSRKQTNTGREQADHEKHGQAHAQDSQENGARPGSSCFWLRLHFSLGDPVTSASSPPPAAVVACGRFTRIAHLRPFSLSPRCFTCIRRYLMKNLCSRGPCCHLNNARVCLLMDPITMGLHNMGLWYDLICDRASNVLAYQ